MAGGDIKGKYGASNVTIPCTFGNNPTGTLSQHGRISDPVDNSSACFQEVLLSGKIKSGTSPSGNKQFIVYGLGSTNNGGNYTDGFTIGDADSAALTVNARPIIPIAAPASTTTYHFGPVAVSVAFGMAIPSKWGLYVFNDHGVTPSTTNSDHGFWYEGQYSQYT